MILGLDFDNTVIDSDEVFYKKALERGLILRNVLANKKAVRDFIRQLPQGEIEWQRLQIYAYGEGIGQAKLIKGVKEVFDACRKASIEVYIISHKTEYPNLTKEKISLRHLALDWMKKNNFFNKNGLGLSPGQVFFESTREDKINRIMKLNCTHFIDDLEETFLEDSFPQDVERILYQPYPEKVGLKDARVFHSWDQIYEYFFAATRK